MPDRERVGGEVCPDHPDHFMPCSKCAGHPCCPHYTDEDVTVYAGDCRDVIRALEDASVDAVITDPPYELGFMGKAWDRAGVAYDVELWRECLRVLKPGGHLLAFGGTRTAHRLAVAVEDAGFELRDSIQWLYGSGFPKSLDVGKAIDRQLGATREVISEGDPQKRMIPGADQNRTGSWIKDNGREYVPTVTEPATEQGAQWDGWGSALKPAHEPIVVARKPFRGTLISNVLEHGTGALNIDATRVAWGEGGDQSAGRKAAGYSDQAKRALGTAVAAESATGFTGEVIGTDSSAGRWPANVVLTHSPDCVHTGQVSVRTDMHYPAARGRGGISVPGHAGQDGLAERAPGSEVIDAYDCAPDCPVAELNAQSGAVGAAAPVRGTEPSSPTAGVYGDRARVPGAFHGDSGGAARFFPVFRYEAKAATGERPTSGGVVHPTVKPLALMRWLIRLVVPRGATVLDCFAGSGTTGEACIVEGMKAVLIEREATYLPLIVARVSKPIEATLDLDVG